MLWAVGLLALDQMVKAWARNAADWTEGRTIQALWPGVFELKLVYNEGVAFGMLQGQGVVLAPIALILAGAAAWYSWKHPDDAKVNHATCSLLIAGALGNLADRLAMGRVTDMFYIRAIDFPVFNVADVCITCAGVLLVLTSLRPKPEPAAQPQGE